MLNQSKIKIFISYHKSCARLNSNILTPIHVGRDLASESVKQELSDMIGDNTGDNISSRNCNYCELTAQYWAWKHCEDDYIGFMHYRRHLNFNISSNYAENSYGLVNYKYIDDYYLSDFGLKDEIIQQVVQEQDIIIARQWKLLKSLNNYDHYASSSKKLHIVDYDKALAILLSKYPEFKDSVAEYNKLDSGYYTNMFVMKKEIFKHYSSWLFDILFALEKEIDISKYDQEEARIFGYISEWLLGIYITYLQTSSKLKVLELQRSLISNVTIVQSKENINVCFSVDVNFIIPLATAIASLLKNTTTTKTIDIYILGEILADEDKKKILALKHIRENINIYFININPKWLDNLKQPVGHLNKSVYYRYFITLLLYNLDKIIYLDSDLIVKGDIAELYNIDVHGYYLAAVQDMVGKRNVAGLKLKSDTVYCNAGVMLLNLKALRKNNVVEQLITTTKEKKDIILYYDQDVINIVCEGKIKYLDLAWNMQYYYENTAVDFDKTKFKEAIKSPKIIHFIGVDKPWIAGSKRLYKEEFFKYLKLTEYHNYKYNKKATESFSIKKIKVLGLPLLQYLDYHNGMQKTIKLLGITLANINIKIKFIDHKKYKIKLFGLFPIISWWVFPQKKKLYILGISFITIRNKVKIKSTQWIKVK